LKEHKLWFYEACLYFLDETKHAKMQWLHDPNQNSVADLNYVRCVASRHFRFKEKEYLKAKIDELEISIKI